MANKEFRVIEEFIEGFTRMGPTPEDYMYDGVIFGMEFQYCGHFYRITRDPIGLENELKGKFDKKTANIKFLKIPNEQYPDPNVFDLNLYIGVFDNVDDLLENGKIKGVSLKEIIVDEKTEILAID